MQKRFFKPAVITAVIAAALAGLFAWSDLWVGTYFANFAQGLAGALLFIAGFALLAVAYFVSTESTMRLDNIQRRSYRSSYSATDAELRAEALDHEKRVSAAEAKERMLSWVSRGMVLLAVLSLVGGTWNAASSWYRADNVYLKATDITDAPQPEFNIRAAWDIASAQAEGALGKIRGEIVTTTYLADKGVYASLVKRKGTGSGSYEAVVEQNLQFSGQSTTVSCEFTAEGRLGGWFSKNIHRKLSHIDRGLVIEESDIYGYCDEQTPMVVIPVMDLVGTMPATRVPAGVAVFNGATGDLDLLRKVEAGQIPGPVYPMSLAARQREALASYDGSWWSSLRGQTGFADTSSDSKDPNKSNRTEFSMARSEDNEDVFVTPLTMRGRSGSIAAVAVIESGHVTAGELNTLVVHELDEPRKANSTVADLIRTDYSDLPDWASGMEIFEIAPTGPDTWTASLGQKQNTIYRVELNADGTSCLLTPAGEKVRCGRVTATDGNGPGVDLAPGDDGTQTPAADSDLRELSDRELAELSEAVTGEMVRRLEKGNDN